MLKVFSLIPIPCAGSYVSNTSEADGIHGTLRLVQSKSDNRKEKPVLFIWQQPNAREQAGTPKRLISSVPLPEEKAGCT